jgi:hypothetical protein
MSELVMPEATVEDLKHLSIVLEKALLCLTSPTMNFQTPLPSTTNLRQTPTWVD